MKIMSIVKNCYLCDLPFEKKHTWKPDGFPETERLHCSKRCFRMYRIAYASDASLRIEHAVKRAQDELSRGAEGSRAIELRLRIATLKRSLRQRKKAQDRSPEPLRD